MLLLLVVADVMLLPSLSADAFMGASSHVQSVHHGLNCHALRCWPQTPAMAKQPRVY
jgi:hypothetical protein